MKKSSLLFLLLMLSSLAYGETKVGEILHKGICWYYNSYHISESYNIIDSKIMNGKTYGQIRMEQHKYDEARAMGHDDLNWYCDTIGIREEGGRIYVNKEEYLSLMTEDRCWSIVGEGEPLPYEETADGELVLYDFTKNVGDVYCQLADGTSLTVTHVGELKTEDGISRRRLTLSNGFDLIEGVGCTNSPGFLLFWLNIQADYQKIYMKNVGLLTTFGVLDENGSFQRILARDFDATVNEMNGRPNKMLTQGRRWVYDYDNGEMKGMLTYSIEGDTLLHAYKRAKVYMTLTDKETKKVVCSGYIGAFNEENQKLCYLSPDSLEAMSLYDFTIGNRRIFDWNGVSRDVINDDYISVGNEKIHRIQMLNRKRDEPLPLDKDSLYYWVEGIGSSKGLFEYSAGTLMDSIQFVGCYDGETCIFTNEDFTKDSGQPSKFSTDMQVDDLFYHIDLGTKTAALLHSDSYQSMNSVEILPSVELWEVDCMVDKIENKSFTGIVGLLSVSMPDGVKSIGDEAFSECTGLTSVVFPARLESLGNKVFAHCTELKTVKLPENLKVIGEHAFDRCTSLTVIDLPSTIDSIGKYAFSRCSSLQDVYCRAVKLPKLDMDRQFVYSNPEATLHVPAASIETYRSTSPWKDFKYIVSIEETTDINALKAETTAFQISDLQGRRLNAEPKHGVYIRNGKKVVK